MAKELAVLFVDSMARRAVRYQDEENEAGMTRQVHVWIEL